MKHILAADYFNVFQLSPAFNIDIRNLTRAYRELQRQYHPDNALTDAALQALYLRASAHINNAYTQLKNPLTRAQILLHQAGINLAETPQLSPLFLHEQMEFHETLEDSSQSAPALEALEQQLKQKEQLLVTGLETAFAQQQLSLASDLSQQLAFYQRLLSRVSDAINLAYSH